MCTGFYRNKYYRVFLHTVRVKFFDVAEQTTVVCLKRWESTDNCNGDAMFVTGLKNRVFTIIETV